MRLHNKWEYEQEFLTCELLKQYPDGIFFFKTKDDRFFKVTISQKIIKCVKNGWPTLIDTDVDFYGKDFTYQQIEAHEFDRKYKGDHSLVYLSFGESIGKRKYIRKGKIYFAPYGFIICKSKA